MFFDGLILKMPVDVTAQGGGALPAAGTRIASG